jgi:hypothetical protein
VCFSINHSFSTTAVSKLTKYAWNR